MDVQERISSVALARPYIPLADSPDGQISPEDRMLLAHAWTGYIIQAPLAAMSYQWRPRSLQWLWRQRSMQTTWVPAAAVP